MKKKPYEQPRVECVRISAEDILVISNEAEIPSAYLFD